MTSMPVLDVDDVVLPTLASAHGALWTLLRDLADRHDRDWVLIGEQMVLLHALQSGRSPNRVSQDLDTIIDARVRPPAVAAFVATLESLGLRAVGVSPDDVAHRFALGDTRIDVLVPEGIGRRAPSVRSVPPAPPRSPAEPKPSPAANACRCATARAVPSCPDPTSSARS